MGGTSFDVSLVEGGKIKTTRETWLGPRFQGHITGLSSVEVTSIVLFVVFGVVMGGLCWEVEPDDWRRLHEINVMGVVHGIRAFVPLMIQRGVGGHIVNMASVSGFVGVGGMATYSASKFAVVGLSESLRADLHRYRIGVSTVCPGFVRTPIQSKVKLVGALDTPRSRARVDRDFARSTLMPDEVARYTLRAIERNQALVYPGREARMAALMHRIAPGLLARMIRG